MTARCRHFRGRTSTIKLLCVQSRVHAPALSGPCMAPPSALLPWNGTLTSPSPYPHPQPSAQSWSSSSSSSSPRKVSQIHPFSSAPLFTHRHRLPEYLKEFPDAFRLLSSLLSDRSPRVLPGRRSEPAALLPHWLLGASGNGAGLAKRFPGLGLSWPLPSALALFPSSCAAPFSECPFQNLHSAGSLAFTF